MARTPRVNVLKLARAHAAVFIESKHFVAAMKAMGLLPRNWEPKKIDAEIVRKLAALQCTMEEIAAWFSVNVSTISRRFANEVALGREAGKISLRRLQWKRARAGSDALLIHLGKHILGQTERIALASQVDVLEALDNADDAAKRFDQGATAAPPDPIEE